MAKLALVALFAPRARTANPVKFAVLTIFRKNL